MSAGCSKCCFAQVMPITNEETFGGLRVIVNWTVVPRWMSWLSESRNKEYEGREWTTNETGHESEWRVVSDQH
jgi:hypothetical protein